MDYVTAAKALNIPFQVEDSLSPEAVSAYETDHILLCPDHYIAATGVEISAMVGPARLCGFGTLNAVNIEGAALQSHTFCVVEEICYNPPNRLRVA